MNDTGVFQSLPGATDPWKVEAVEMDTARETVTTGPGLKEGTVRGCPACRRRMHVHGRERRRWWHHGNLPAFFARRGTNASAEAVNSRIQSLINQACGYRNPRRLVTEIFFHHGDPGLAPRFPR